MRTAQPVNALVSVAVIIWMLVAPFVVLGLFFTLQLGEFTMGFVLALFPSLVGSVFVVVPSMAIPTIAVVRSVGAVVIPILRGDGLEAQGRDQDRTQQK